MFLPWVGLFQQVSKSNIFVHLDDVQYPQGRSFCGRVQIKTNNGKIWLNVPTIKNGKQNINKKRIDNVKNWKSEHLTSFEKYYCKARYFDFAYDVLQKIYENDFEFVSELNIFSVEYIANILGLNRKFLRSSSLEVTGHKSERLINILKRLGGTVYITGHGGSKYLEHSLFEKEQISVEYMQYSLREYKQQFNEFDPYVSILDLLANQGEYSRDFLNSVTTSWQEFS